MADYGHEFAELTIWDIEGDIKEEFRKAYEDISSEIEEFKKKHQQELNEYVSNLGKTVTPGEMRSWQVEQAFQLGRLETLEQYAAERMVYASRMAGDIINGRLPTVYAENFEFSTWEIAEFADPDKLTAFSLIDENTIRSLTGSYRTYLPNDKKCENWNRRKLRSAVTQGIIRGESMDDIALRILKIPGMNEENAITAARTMVTSAENAGRFDSYRRAANMGIRLQKRWLATFDPRTRESHRMLDGVIQDWDKPFITINGEEIMFPGDEHASGAEVFNCRCTVTAYFEEMGDEGLEERSTAAYLEWKSGKDGIGSKNE